MGVCGGGGGREVGGEGRIPGYPPVEQTDTRAGILKQIQSLIMFIYITMLKYRGLKLQLCQKLRGKCVTIFFCRRIETLQWS